MAEDIVRFQVEPDFFASDGVLDVFVGVVFGRTDFACFDGSISRSLARVTRDGGNYMLEHLGSCFGTLTSQSGQKVVDVKGKGPILITPMETYTVQGSESTLGPSRKLCLRLLPPVAEEAVPEKEENTLEVVYEEDDSTQVIDFGDGGFANESTQIIDFGDGGFGVRVIGTPSESDDEDEPVKTPEGSADEDDSEAVKTPRRRCRLLDSSSEEEPDGGRFKASKKKILRRFRNKIPKNLRISKQESKTLVKSERLLLKENGVEMVKINDESDRSKESQESTNMDEFITPHPDDAGILGTESYFENELVAAVHGHVFKAHKVKNKAVLTQAMLKAQGFKIPKPIYVHPKLRNIYLERFIIDAIHDADEAEVDEQEAAIIKGEKKIFQELGEIERRFDDDPDLDFYDTPRGKVDLIRVDHLYEEEAEKRKQALARFEQARAIYLRDECEQEEEKVEYDEAARRIARKKWADIVAKPDDSMH